MVITMTMRNTDFANLLRSHTKHRVPLRLHPACPTGSRQPNLKEENDFDKYEVSGQGVADASGAPAKMETGRTEQRNKGDLTLRK
jgi:hypothetical protein